MQLDEAVSLDEARLAAAQAGLNYPTAEQIVEVNGAVGGYMNGAAKTQTEPEQTAWTGGRAGAGRGYGAERAIIKGLPLQRTECGG
ncbi:MAG: hypothetical protein V8Q85_06980 [Christensenellales bacterium]